MQQVFLLVRATWEQIWDQICHEGRLAASLPVDYKSILCIIPMLRIHYETKIYKGNIVYPIRWIAFRLCANWTPCLFRPYSQRGSNRIINGAKCQLRREITKWRRRKCAPLFSRSLRKHVNIDVVINWPDKELSEETGGFTLITADAVSASQRLLIAKRDRQERLSRNEPVFSTRLYCLSDTISKTPLCIFVAKKCSPFTILPLSVKYSVTHNKKIKVYFIHYVAWVGKIRSNDRITKKYFTCWLV